MSAINHLRRRRARLAAVITGLALCAPAATAVAQPSDQIIPAGHSSIVVRSPEATPPVVTPSPDARDAAVAAVAATPSSRPDPRSPDAQDAGLAATTTSRPDPRSPDARDAGTVARGLRSPSVLGTTSVVARDEHPDALPLALSGAALALALLAAGGVAFITRGRRQSVSVSH